MSKIELLKQYHTLFSRYQ